MINVAAGLISWSPFRKELSRWSRKIDLFTEHDADMSSEPSEVNIRSKNERSSRSSTNTSTQKSSAYRYQSKTSDTYSSYNHMQSYNDQSTKPSEKYPSQSTEPTYSPRFQEATEKDSSVPSTSTGTFARYGESPVGDLFLKNDVFCCYGSTE